jgi:hypothetical protein
MFTQALGRIFAVVALVGLVGVLIVLGAFFVECASWGQCPEVTQLFAPKPPQKPATP